MTRLRGLFLAAAACGTVACGGGRTPSSEGQRPPRTAQIVAVTDSLLTAGGCDTLRFGRLHAGEIAERRLWIENRTQRAVALLSYERTCGCTTLAFDTEPLAPGGAMPVVVRFDSRGERGWQLKLVELRLAGAARNLRLFVEAEVD